MGKPIYDFTRTLHDLPYLSQDMMVMMDVKSKSHRHICLCKYNK